MSSRLPTPPAALDTRLYALAVGVIVLGLYASQALIPDLAGSLGVSVPGQTPLPRSPLAFALLALAVHWFEPKPDADARPEPA